MKTAFVLSGGGSKGAYEIGFLKAMMELNIQPNIVTGTSIGALNGCLIAQHDEHIAIQLWENMTMDQIIKDGIQFDFSLESLISQSNLVIPFFKSYINYKGANITPMISLIHRLSSEEKLMKSSIDFGLVTVEYPSLIPIEITKNEIPKGQLADYLIASASCFPAFPIHHFNNHGYIDGGYYDNLPIELAFKLGAQKIIAVEMTPKKFTHVHYTHRPNIKYISPLNDLGNFLDFDEKTLKKRITLGYLDTMKAFNRYIGYSYTFHPITTTDTTNKFYLNILNYETKLNKQFIKSKIKLFDSLPLTHLLLNKTNKSTLSIEDYSIIALEMCANLYKIPVDQIYNFNSLNQVIINSFDLSYDQYQKDYVFNHSSINKIIEFLTTLSSKELVYYIYNKIKNNKIFDSTWLITNFSTECIIAMYIYHLKHF
ncbi:MAG: patatin-like phospholipase family protein [Erysipelotrichaceae bacterium]|nr:patatin-like phospholipase family protein [Erysipelotrichaceae bacterium]